MEEASIPSALRLEDSGHISKASSSSEEKPPITKDTHFTQESINPIHIFNFQVKNI